MSSLSGLAFGASRTIYAVQNASGVQTEVMYKISHTTGHATKLGMIAGASKLPIESLAF